MFCWEINEMEVVRVIFNVYYKTVMRKRSCSYDALTRACWLICCRENIILPKVLTFQTYSGTLQLSPLAKISHAFYVYHILISLVISVSHPNAQRPRSLSVAITLDRFHNYPDSKVRGANMGPTGVLSAPDGPHVGHRNFAIRVYGSVD